MILNVRTLEQMVQEAEDARDLFQWLSLGWELYIALIHSVGRSSIGYKHARMKAHRLKNRLLDVEDNMLKFREWRDQ